MFNKSSISRITQSRIAQLLNMLTQMKCGSFRLQLHVHNERYDLPGRKITRPRISGTNLCAKQLLSSLAPTTITLYSAQFALTPFVERNMLCTFVLCSVPLHRAVVPSGDHKFTYRDTEAPHRKWRRRRWRPTNAAADKHRLVLCLNVCGCYHFRRWRPAQCIVCKSICIHSSAISHQPSPQQQ